MTAEPPGRGTKVPGRETKDPDARCGVCRVSNMQGPGAGTQKAMHEAGEPGPASVTAPAVSGLPAVALIDASRDGDLIVAGSRGGGPQSS